MSIVKVIIHAKNNYNIDISVDGKFIVTIDDAPNVDSVYYALKILFEKLDVNVEVERR